MICLQKHDLSIGKIRISCKNNIAVSKASIDHPHLHCSQNGAGIHVNGVFTNVI